jgi:hypothetical protein
MFEHEAISKLKSHGVDVSTKYAGAPYPYFIGYRDRCAWVKVERMIAYAETGVDEWFEPFKDQRKG